MSAFTEAYNRSRYWHGDKFGNINEIAAAGLLVEKSDCLPNSSDPSFRGGGGGIICLGVSCGVSGDYGAPGNIARVFMNLARGGRCEGLAAPAADARRFAKGNDKLWRDGGAVSAVCTWASIPADWIWVGTLTDLCRQGSSSRKLGAILRNIASFDQSLPTEIGALKALMTGAVRGGEIGDDVLEPGAENPILGSGSMPVPPPAQARQSRCALI